MTSAFLNWTISNFYPRPPRGGRLVRDGPMLFCRKFLSTPSARRATFFDMLVPFAALISIHALREEGDSLIAANARPPHRFLSTPSARRATDGDGFAWALQDISIHALREEGDQFYHHPADKDLDFYPRPPRGGRRDNKCLIFPQFNFYPRPPRGGRHYAAGTVRVVYHISIHALREEGDAVHREDG